MSLSKDGGSGEDRQTREEEMMDGWMEKRHDRRAGSFGLQGLITVAAKRNKQIKDAGGEKKNPNCDYGESEQVKETNGS